MRARVMAGFCALCLMLGLGGVAFAITRASTSSTNQAEQTAQAKASYRTEVRKYQAAMEDWRAKHDVYVACHGALKDVYDSVEKLDAMLTSGVTRAEYESALTDINVVYKQQLPDVMAAGDECVGGPRAEIWDVIRPWNQARDDWKATGVAGPDVKRAWSEATDQLGGAEHSLADLAPGPKPTAPLSTPPSAKTS